MHKDNFNGELMDINGILSETERAQVESFFSSLGTEVNAKQIYIFLVFELVIFVPTNVIRIGFGRMATS